MLDIRAASTDDLSRMLDLWKVGLPFDQPDADAHRAFLDGCAYGDAEDVLVAEEDATLLGFVLSVSNQPETGWIPLLAVRPEASGSRAGDLLLGGVEQRFRAKGLREARVSPFGHKVRFATGIDARHSQLLNLLSRNGYQVTDASQVDIERDLRSFEMPRAVRDAMERLNAEGITFGCCEPALVTVYAEFMTTHFPWWYDADIRQDPGRAVLARHGDEVVGFTAFSKDRDWYIRATGVRPDFRWKRIGTVLVHLAMEEMKRRGVSRMCVSDCPIEFYKVVEGEVVRRYVTLTKRLGDG